jgi:glycosyltransferase involved in cell wall biosynthesis
VTSERPTIEAAGGVIARGSGLALAVVLWSGYIGGAETLGVALTEHLRRLGANATLVFVQQPGPLGQRLAVGDVPYRNIGLGRGRDVIRHPRQFANGVAEVGGDGALLLECGFIGAALRGGGYRGPIVAVEHGVLLGLRNLSRSRQVLWHIGRVSGAWADDVEVAVSDSMLEEMRRHSHARRTERIYNGIDPEAYRPVAGSSNGHGSALVVGFAGRLIPGKGADVLIRAIALAGQGTPINLVIAGDGAARPYLQSLAEGLGASVEFRGVVADLAEFWRSCDVAAIPSDTFRESFSMATLEAMASGKAVVASRNGAIPELMVDDVTGTLVEPGDVDALAQAVLRYAERPELRQAHGAAARARAIEQFHIEDCARAYLDLFVERKASLGARRG